MFPQEGKCIIIELKAPDVDVSKYLHQIKQYASMINSFTMPDFKIKSFYGYLIGENINVSMVRFSDPNFERSYDDSIVCPNTKVIGIGGVSDGFLYMEILKYSTLLKRAQLRNKIFIEKLGVE